MSRTFGIGPATLACIAVMSTAIHAQSVPPFPPAALPEKGATAPARPVGTPARPPVTTTLESDYRIGPEDVLDILVWKNADLTRTVAVRPDGRISLPLLNDIMAAGLTPMELRAALATGFGPYVNDAEVSVVVKEIHSFKVSVIGMVKNPGRYELKSQATILEALALAGGLTEFAKRDRIALFRSDGRRWQRFGFDYGNVIYENAEQNFILRPGDIVVVP